MESMKKKRAENWSAEEKEILRQLIAQSAHIIEDKSTKTSINNLKVKEWKNIMNKLNTITGKSRTEGEVKLAWKRMKLSAKYNLSSHRREQLQTGGGEKPPSPSPEDLEIMAIAPHDFVIEVNEFDSDAVIETTSKESIAGPSTAVNDDNVIIIEKNPEPIYIEKQVLSSNMPSSSPAANKKKSSLNRTEKMRHMITQSNIDFKQKQLEMMEIEHKNNVHIQKLQIQKLELEIALLKKS